MTNTIQRKKRMKQETRNDILSRKKEMTFFKVVRIIDFVTSLNDWAVFKCLMLNDTGTPVPTGKSNLS